MLRDPQMRIHFCLGTGGIPAFFCLRHWWNPCIREGTHEKETEQKAWICMQGI